MVSTLVEKLKDYHNKIVKETWCSIHEKQNIGLNQIFTTN